MNFGAVVSDSGAALEANVLRVGRIGEGAGDGTAVGRLVRREPVGPR